MLPGSRPTSPITNLEQETGPTLKNCIFPTGLVLMELCYELPFPPRPVRHPGCAGFGPPQCLWTIVVLWGEKDGVCVASSRLCCHSQLFPDLFLQNPFLPGDRTVEHKEAILKALSLAIMLESQRFNYCVRAIPLKEKLQQSHHLRRFSAETDDSRNAKEQKNAALLCSPPPNPGVRLSDGTKVNCELG